MSDTNSVYNPPDQDGSAAGWDSMLIIGEPQSGGRTIEGDENDLVFNNFGAFGIKSDQLGYYNTITDQYVVNIEENGFFQLFADLSNDGSVRDRTLQINSDGATNFKSANGNGDGFLDRFVIEAGSDKQDIYFPNTNVLYITNLDSDARFGINVPTPSCVLDILGADLILRIRNVAQTDLLTFYENGEFTIFSDLNEDGSISGSTFNIATDGSLVSYSLNQAQDSYIQRFIISGSSDIAQAGFTDTNLGIGTVSPDEALHVVGSIKMVDGNEAEGNIMTSDATGKGVWTVPKYLSTAGKMALFGGISDQVRILSDELSQTVSVNHVATGTYELSYVTGIDFNSNNMFIINGVTANDDTADYNIVLHIDDVGSSPDELYVYRNGVLSDSSVVFNFEIRVYN